MSDDYIEPSAGQLIPPPQSPAASGMGLAPAQPPLLPRRPADTGGQPYAAIGAPGVKVNSRGQPYSTALENMPPHERANMEAATAALRSGNRAPLQRQVAPALPPHDSAAGHASREQQGGVGAGAPAEYPADLDHIILAKEGGSDNSIGTSGEIGRNQIMPQTAAQYGVSREQLFDPQTNMNLGNRIRRDLWNKYHDKTAVMIGYNAGPGAAERWLASGKDPNSIPATTRKYIGAPSTLSDSWNASLPPELRESLDYSRAARGQLDALQAEFLKESRQPVSGSAERQREMDRLHADIHHATEEWMALTKRPPVEKPVDMWQNFGSAASIVALLGGLFAKHHLSASLNAAGLAMQAINTNNHQQFKQQWDTWKTETEYGLKLIDLKQREIDDILKDDKLAWDHKMAKMKMITDVAGMKEHTAALARGDVMGFVAANNSLTRGLSQTAKAAEDLDLIQRYNAAFQSKSDAFYADPANAGKVPTADDELRWKNEIIPTLQKLGSTAALNPRNQAAQAFASEIETKEGRRPTAAEWSKYFQDTKGSQTGKLEPETVQFLAKQYEMGDPGVITALPRSGSARIDVENQVAKDLRGMDDAAKQVVMNRIRMALVRSAATTAGRITMQTDLYATEAIGAGRMVVDTSKAFPRTNFPTVNAALEAYQRHTGDPNVIQFGIALNALFNVYGKMSNPTGTGIHDADKERLSKQLDIALSQGQIEAGVDQIIKEGQNVASSALQAQQQVLESLAPSEPRAAPATPHPASAPVSGKAIIQNGWRYDPATHQPLGPAQ